MNLCSSIGKPLWNLEQGIDSFSILVSSPIKGDEDIDGITKQLWEFM